MCSPVTLGLLVLWGSSRVCSGGYQGSEIALGAKVGSLLLLLTAVCPSCSWDGPLLLPLPGVHPHAALGDTEEDGGAERGKRRGHGEVF